MSCQHQLGRLVLAAPLFAALLAVAGCSKSGSEGGRVSGKVTLGGQPVTGEVIFTVGDKSVSAAIKPDGTYAVISPPVGSAKVSVKGDLNQSGKAPAGTKMPDMGQGAGAGVAPPKKYSSPDNGLTFDVKGGDQTFDIELKP